MFRSQTDEQLAARHDPEPWIAGDNGWSDRFAIEADALEVDSRHPAAIFEPRVECIPSRDPLPYTGWNTNRRTKRPEQHDRPNNWAPRPEFARPPVNRILEAYRAYLDAHRIDTYAEYWLFGIASFDTFGGFREWSNEDHNFHALATATHAEIEHARKVLARLAQLTKEA